jgi:hypothetical protein
VALQFALGSDIERDGREAPVTAAAMSLRRAHSWYFNSLRQAGNNADHGNHVATIGIGFVWGGARKTTN